MVISRFGAHHRNSTAAALFGTSVPLAHAGVAGTLNCEA
ncbi:hypothetical protein QU962_25445, partial [Escherichia coli]|nr:hypothetical protein [Escherichia coli]MDM8688876.1 hypothetical protein [Escherichia coli]